MCATLFLFSFLIAGCTFVELKEDVKYAETSTVLVGIVSSNLPVEGAPIVVAAYSKDGRKRTILHYTTLHELGPYELLVPSGTHSIVAFADKNQNLTYDRGELYGQILSTEQTPVPPGGVVAALDIVISKQNGKIADFPVGSKVPPKKYRGFHSTSPGAVARLDDELFSDDYADKGLWTPIEFFQEIGGNIYFLEKYDPTKIPILLVHGAAGSPRNWRAFLESLDRDRYQPWFFYYPSGASIDSMAYLLLWKLENLQAKYRFQELYITAHSMGGLVVRSFLVNYGHFFPSITNFFSISTPWGGEELAELGVKYSPAVIPAWRDIQPGSAFIDSIFAKKLPPTVDYYLFFGHKGNRNILRPNNDEVVTLASQLDQRSQRDAKMIYGFNEDHVSILSSKLVLSQYDAILSDIHQKTRAADNVLGNRLDVDYSFDFPEERPRPGPALLLRPVGKKGADTWIQLNSEDTGRECGPFPSGNYEVTMIAPAFAPEPVSRRISIGEGTVPRVEFLMKPVGFLRGYVVKGEPGYVQAGKYRQRDTEVQIRSITLEGNGIHRTVTPLPGEATGRGNYDPLIPSQEQGIDYPEYYLSGTDFTSNGIFFFFDLPAGKYELTIDAKGYKPHSEKCDVRPGDYKNTLHIELEREIARHR